MNDTLFKARAAKVGRAPIYDEGGSGVYFESDAGVSDGMQIQLETSGINTIFNLLNSGQSLPPVAQALSPANVAFNCLVGQPALDANNNWFCDTSTTFNAPVPISPSVILSTRVPKPVVTPAQTVTPVTDTTTAPTSVSDVITKITDFVKANPYMILGGAALGVYLLMKK